MSNYETRFYYVQHTAVDELEDVDVKSELYNPQITRLNKHVVEV